MERRAILVVGGAFNPIHTQHIDLLCLAKQELETSGQWTIVGGYFAVAPDNYVRRKLSSRSEPTIRLEHRLALVRLAIDKVQWLRESPFQMEMLKQHDGSASALAQRLNRLMKSNDIESLIVKGADRMVKRGVPIWRQSNAMHVAVGRKTDEKLDLHALWRDDLSKNLILHPDRTILLEKSCRSVSSSLVRIELRRWFEGKSDRNQREMIEEDLVVKNEYLSRQVMEYIETNEENLYI